MTRNLETEPTGVEGPVVVGCWVAGAVDVVVEAVVDGEDDVVEAGVLEAAADGAETIDACVGRLTHE